MLYFKQLFFSSICLCSPLFAKVNAPKLSEGIIELQENHNKDSHLIPLKIVNLNPYQGIQFLVKNIGSSFCRVDALIGEDWQTMKSSAFLHPTEQKSIHILFKRNVKYLDGANENFPEMNGIPGGGLKHWVDVDFSKGIQQLKIKIHSDSKIHNDAQMHSVQKKLPQVQITDIRPFGAFQTPERLSSTPNFFPFVDRYGQYKYDDWDQKVTTDSDLQKALKLELKDLENHPAPSDRSPYGGWTTGPKQKATGHFRTQKWKDKWWLVDPAGHLFWSYGVTGVGQSFGLTLIEGREHIFDDIPTQHSDFGEFSNEKTPSFNNRHTHSYGMANLKRKYGEHWRQRDREMSQKRIASWGLNTLGMWSDYDQQVGAKHPYTVHVHFPFPKIKKDLRCPDAFNPKLPEIMAEHFQKHTKDTAKDPFNIGYFICNELRFAPSGDRKAFDVCDAYLQQEIEAPGRQAILHFLKGHYLNSIDKLNEAWGSQHQNFEDIKTIPYDQVELGNAFERLYADKLYALFRKSIKTLAPNKLYLGSRFVHSTPGHIMEAAAVHMDVFSINWYQSSPDHIHIPYHMDKPVVIGEFHFGAVGLGVYNPGLVAVGTQEQRADNMYYYYQDALLHPNIVGAHWFQYRSQAFTGRKDGECYQIGMVDITDHPNPQQRAKLREMGKNMYGIRSSGERR